MSEPTTCVWCSEPKERHAADKRCPGDRLSFYTTMPTTPPEPTTEQLNEWLSLAEAASLGPWTYEVSTVFTPTMRSYTVWQDRKAGAPGWGICAMLMTSDLDDDCKENASKNGPFIAAARLGFPAVCRALLRLRTTMLEFSERQCNCDATEPKGYKCVGCKARAALAACEPGET